MYPEKTHLHKAESIPFWFMDPEEMSQRRKAHKISQKSLLHKKQQHLAAITQHTPAENQTILESILHLIDKQKRHLKTTILQPHKHHKHDEPLPIKTLKPHLNLLKKYFGTRFAHIEHAIHLDEELPQSQLERAFSCLVDAKRVENIHTILNQQTDIVQHMMHKQETKDHRSYLALSFDEELTHILALTHQDTLVAAWL